VSKKYLIEDETLTGIAEAIRAKTGETGKMTTAEMPEKIAAIQTSGGEISAAEAAYSDVNFYDYDGTRLYSYTVEEAAALTELPPLPSHEGLICQGWNWSLAEVQAGGRAVDVGAMYITDDGKTRLYITILSTIRMNVPLYFSQTVANGVTIDWGDGSDTETLSGTGFVNTTHQYAAVGDYVISLTVADGCTVNLGGGQKDYCVLGSVSWTACVYSSMLRAVRLGKGITRLGQYTFEKCALLETITLPSGMESVGINQYEYCQALKAVVIPDTVTVINNYAFNNCCTLKMLSIPNSVQTIGTYAFGYCEVLVKITVPAGVTSIGERAFEGAYCSIEYYMKPATPPTLTSIYLIGISTSDTVIYVPKGCLNAYKSATNWSSYKSYMKEEP
jgi:hypothetical protein